MLIDILKHHYTQIKELIPPLPLDHVDIALIATVITLILYVLYSKIKLPDYNQSNNQFII